MSSQLGQAGLPRGIVGHMVGRIMRWYNRPDNAWTLDLLGIDAGEQVLEVGFGPGDAIRLAAESSPLSHIAGVDHSAAMLDAAQRLNREAVAQGRVQLALGSVDKLPYTDNAFDKVFSINCVYFWPELALGLTELHRVVKPDGLLALTVRDRERSAYDAFRPDRLEQSLVDAGFSSIEVHRNGVPAHPLICVVGTK